MTVLYPRLPASGSGFMQDICNAFLCMRLIVTYDSLPILVYIFIIYILSDLLLILGKLHLFGLIDY